MTAVDVTQELAQDSERPPSEDLARSYFAVDDVRLAFGGLQVLQGVGFAVPKGQIVGLIGPNGAGKTTLFDVISGFRPQARGRVWFKGVNLLERKPHERPWLGLGRTFQTARLFQNVTVYDCIRTACHVRMRRSSVGAIFRSALDTPKSRAEEKMVIERTEQVIERLRLGDYAKKFASELSYGTLRLTELATILAVEPELILLDEPSSGIAQKETEALGPLLIELRDELHATFLLIEHDMPLIMGISDHIVALAAGQVLAEGTPEEVQNNPAVVESYLGGSFEDLG
jgi:ABC-type branched-subunit amino acid transport system ATPase component